MVQSHPCANCAWAGEDFYRAVHAAADRQPSSTSFPPTYPTGVLLTCVAVVSCLKVGQGSVDWERWQRGPLTVGS